MLVEPRPQFVAERFVFWGQGEVHGTEMLAGHLSRLTGHQETVPTRRWRRGECAVDFTFDDGAAGLAGRGPPGHGGGRRRRRCVGWPTTPSGSTPEQWARLGPARVDGDAAAGLGRRAAGDVHRPRADGRRARCPAPSSPPSVYATLAARALGADDLLDGSGRRRPAGHGGAPRAGPRPSRSPPCGPGPGAKARAGWCRGSKPIVVDGHTRGLGDRGGPGRGRHPLVPPAVSTGAEAVPNLDPTRKLARLVLDDEPVEPLGPTGDQTGLWRVVLDDVAVALSAELIGVSHRALDEAVEYAKERVVFDRPIATFQSVKHRIVDMFHSLEMARAGVHFAAWASDTGAPERARAAAMAAAYATETAVRVTGDNIQVHGGVGFTWANDAHFLFTRAKQNEVLLGGSGIQWHQVASGARRRLSRSGRRDAETIGTDGSRGGGVSDGDARGTVGSIGRRWRRSTRSSSRTRCRGTSVIPTPGWPSCAAPRPSTPGRSTSATACPTSDPDRPPPGHGVRLRRGGPGAARRRAVLVVGVRGDHGRRHGPDHPADGRARTPSPPRPGVADLPHQGAGAVGVRPGHRRWSTS